MASGQEEHAVPEQLWSHRRCPRLIYAIYSKNVALVKVMLNMAPVYIDIKDDCARTPLHVAIAVGSPEILHLLLQHNVIDINARNSEDCTPLHNAINMCSLALVQVLLYHGADANARCRQFNNQTPFLMCLSSNCDDIAWELLEYVGDFNDADNFDRSALYYALVGSSALTSEIVKRRAEAVLPVNFLLLSLYHSDNSLFNYCWRRIRCVGIFTRMLLVLLSNDCKFMNHEWIDTILTILESFQLLRETNQTVSLCTTCDDYWDYHLFPNLFIQMSNRRIEQEPRYTIVYAFLSNGAQVRGLDGYTFLQYYNFPDKEEMLHTLVQGGYNVDNSLYCICSDTNPAAVMLYLRYTSFSLNNILGKMLIAQMVSVYQQVRSIETLLRLCTPNARNIELYFRVFRKRFNNTLNHVHGHWSYQNNILCLMRLRKVPSLLEFSRDKVRSVIGRRFKTSCSFCCVVKHLDLPEELKRIVLYERPLPNL